MAKKWNMHILEEKMAKKKNLKHAVAIVLLLFFAALGVGSMGSSPSVTSGCPRASGSCNAIIACTRGESCSGYWGGACDCR